MGPHLVGQLVPILPLVRETLGSQEGLVYLCHLWGRRGEEGVKGWGSKGLEGG